MAARWTSSSTTSAKNEKFQHTKLDESKESLSLLSILRAFDGPVTEERAWAILYQSAKTGLQCFNSANPPPPTTSRHNNNNQQQSHQQHANNNIHNLTDKSENEVMKCVVVGETSHLWIHRDGHVHPHSFQEAADSIEADEERTVAEREEQLVSGLGWALYEALDYGCIQNEQNILSPDLEQMIDFLTSADVSSSSMTSSSSASAASAMTSLTHIMDRCRMQISSTIPSNQQDAHFRDICRALVAETLEFSDFLDIISSAAAPPEAHPPPRPTPPAPPEAPTAAWAKLWMQVIRQLRNGVKLKSASERKLGPLARRVSTPVELPMESIRQHDSKELRPTLCLLVNRTDGQHFKPEENIVQKLHEEAIEFFKQLSTQRKNIEKSQQLLEKNLAAARRIVQEEEMRLRQIKEELDEREQQLSTREREFAEIQSRAAIGLDNEATQLLHQGQDIQNIANIVVDIRVPHVTLGRGRSVFAPGPPIAPVVGDIEVPDVPVPPAQPLVGPRRLVMRSTIRQTAPKPYARPSTGVNRFPRPQHTAPAMHAVRNAAPKSSAPPPWKFF